jgi:hypothetical protein
VAGAAVAVAVDDRWHPRLGVARGARRLELEPYGGAAGPQTDTHAEKPRAGELRHQPHGARDDRFRHRRIGRERFHADLGRAAEHAIVAARDDVDGRRRLVLVQHDAVEARVLDQHDLAAHRHHRRVTGERARAEAAAVDDQ